MTETESTPLPFSYDGYHHVTLWVGNALQASSMFCIRFGFEPVLYRGLETGHKDVASHVVRHKGIFLVFESPLSNEVMSNHIAKHGDGVRDFAITVSDCAAAFKVNHCLIHSGHRSMERLRLFILQRPFPMTLEGLLSRALRRYVFEL